MMIYLYFIYMFFFSIGMFIMSMSFYFLNQGLIMEWLFFSLMSINLEFLFYFDWVSSLFVSMVSFIFSMILLYSVTYMEGDKSLMRYFYLVKLFVLSMIIMVMSPNMVSIMVGWDGLGLVSFCLVIYYQNYSSYNSGMLTVLLNRFGDVMILMVIGLGMSSGSWNLSSLMGDNMVFMMFMLIASMTKSAQIPFSSWLPSAMAAPTPVSALVHSSTLVTAGVYLMIRYSNFLIFSGMNEILMVLSVLTMFMSGLMANFEFDMKKIIALSTLSQLGLMMLILSMGFPMLSFYHLLTHAVFKSLLFMSAGGIIHLMGNNQDIRGMGSLSSRVSFLFVSFEVSVVALCGFPFFSGFYSKDLIMEMLNLMEFNILLFFMILLSVLFTVTYSFRMGYYIFFKEVLFMGGGIFEDFRMSISMLMLMIMSVMMGSLMNWLFFMEYSSFLSIELKLMALGLGGLGVIFLLLFKSINFIRLYYMMYLLSSMWFLNYMYMYIVKYMVNYGSEIYYEDKVWMEYYSNKFLFEYIFMGVYYFKNYGIKMFMYMFWFVYLLFIFF